jgi:hypothetical protein
MKIRACPGLGATLVYVWLAALLGCDGGTSAVPLPPPPPQPNDSGSPPDGGLGGLADACTQIPLPEGGTVHVTGVVQEGITDGGTPKPIAGAMIAVEYGGLYLPYCDMASASPYYVFGAVSDANGAFAMDARAGKLGFHGFANNYYYSRAALDTATGTTVSLELEPLPPGQAQPKVADAGFDNADVGVGTPVTFSAGIATWDSKDPLSDENVVVEGTGSFGMELNPPSVGMKDDFPDGLWQRKFSAPSTPGTYTYWFSATTAGCVTSPLFSSTLTVH